MFRTRMAPARAALAVACWMLAAGLSMAQPLTTPDRDLLAAAWLHTSGANSFDYKVVIFDTQERARVGRLTRWDPARGYKPSELHADSLVDVEPALRKALAELHTAGRRSEPVRWVRRSGAVHWVVIELVRVERTVRPRDTADFDERARRWVAAGLLPPPAELAAQPEHRARAAFWNAVTPEAVRAVPADLNPDVHYGSGMTPLTQALLGGRLPLAQALIVRGADPNRCGFWGCPLHLAATVSDATVAREAVKALLAAGARPDQRDDAWSAARNTPLNDAMQGGQVELVRQLLDAGASADGAPGVQITPLAQAMLTGKREAARVLLERGASALPHADRGRDDLGRPYTVVRAAVEGRQAELVPWAEELMASEAKRAPRYRFQARIEQDGKSFPLDDGARLVLRAAAFKLVLTLPPPADEAGVVLAASFSPALATEVRESERRNGIFVSSRSSALVEPPSEDSYDLMLYDTRPANLKPDEGWGGNMSLSVQDQRRDFHEIRADRHEYVREFRRVLEVTEGQPPYREAPLSELKGRRITLALGGFLPTEEWVGRLVSPRVVTIELR